MGNTETGDNKNEQIAAEGRARTQEGLANLRGQPVVPSAPPSSRIRQVPARVLVASVKVLQVHTVPEAQLRRDSEVELELMRSRHIAVRVVTEVVQFLERAAVMILLAHMVTKVRLVLMVQVERPE